MNLQRALVPVLLIGGVLAGGAMYLGALRSRRPSRKPRTRRLQPLMVRVTENGKKYHRDNCPLLRGSYRSIPVLEALEHYTPCRACHPPGA